VPTNESEPAVEAEPQSLEGPAPDDIELELEPMADMEEAQPAAVQPASESTALEDLSEIALYDAADEVVDPDHK